MVLIKLGRSALKSMGMGLVLLLGSWLGTTAQAQVPGGLSEPESAEEQASEAPPDPLGRTSPQGMVLGLVEAMADEDYERAALFLNLNERVGIEGEVAAQHLQTLLDEGGWLASNWRLSSDPEGRQDDGLRPGQEQFASVRTEAGVVHLLAERVDRPDGEPVWLVSDETVRQLPELMRMAQLGFVDRHMPRFLKDAPRLGGVPLGDWLALLVLALGAYLTAWLITWIASLALRRVWRHRDKSESMRLLSAGIQPASIFLAVWLFAIATVVSGVSVVARQRFGYVTDMVAWMALGWLVWRLTNVIAELSGERLARNNHLGALSAVRFLRRTVKVAVAAVVIIAILDSFGVDVTAGLAALGIGGLAIALGAQKTVENLVGSVTLLADQPVRVGDFCRFGQTIGTVEDIGMRSTRIRTLDRTVVTVPNGEFSGLQIENFAHRDRFWFHPFLPFRFETTPDQMRYLLVELRSMLYAHPKVDPTPARVRFLGLNADSLKVEIFAYVNAVDFDDFLEVQEDLMLRIMDIIAASGTALAFPSQTLYMSKDAGTDDQKRQAAEEAVRRWREVGDLPLPRFSPDRIESLKGTIPYPPEGSSVSHATSTAPTDSTAAQNEPAAGARRRFWFFRRR